MSNCNNIVSVLTKNGSDQKQRYIDALQPSNTKLIEFDVADWILFAYNFAKHINYFETSSNSVTSDWKAFFDYFNLESKSPTYEERFELLRIKEEINSIIAEYQEDASLTPHLTLFITFLMLLEDHSKTRFNNITKEHLDFYYNEILQIQKQPATPDKVYMVFELAKNATQQKIEAKTAFDGGKDANGKSRTYYSNEELIANKTIVSALKNVYHDGTAKKIVAASVANSYDGLGKTFPDENTQWWPFGYTNDSKYPELPSASLGFAVSSPILALSEGKRSIEFTFSFEETIDTSSFSNFSEYISLHLTTAKQWYEAAISETVTAKTATYHTSINDKVMKIAVQLDENCDAVTNYNSKVYNDEFNSELPLAKFVLNTAEENGYQLYRSLVQNKLASITIAVDVQNMKSNVLESDNSILNTTKPFYPFTTIPIEGSNFYIKNEEALSKNWSTININITWKNTPSDFATHYKAYKNSAKNSISVNEFKTSLLNGTNFKTTDGIVTNDAYFKFDIAVLSDNVWKNASENQTLFTKLNSVYYTNFQVTRSLFNTEKNGQLKMVLKQSFLHNLYPKIYALALAGNDANVVLPNEPYTPFVDGLTLDYSASETSNFNEVVLKTPEEVYTENNIKLYHIHPFGYSEEHLYLKSLLDYVEDENSYLLPAYCKGGELYIGLENTEDLEQITLLFQVSEGSENPLTESFTGKQKIEWSVLGNNQWKTLEYSDILLNETDNLLQSGIFKFNLPKEVTKSNTTLSGNYVWLKAKMHKKYDAVCKIIGIHTQVVLATFEDNNNELSHLSTGIEANTISKLGQRISAVKSVTQHYNSFDYKPEETDTEYYRRTSERLRHKNRSVTMWDYEHIILQEFPELYKVKCLNHTSETSYQAPGNVTLIVVPDTVNKNVFDIYQPRVSTATLNKVKDHITQLNSMHVNTFVINPNYEEVSVDLKVKFKSGYDENYYSQELSSDITKFLSPWAYDKNIPITFGVKIHISELINYIEKLTYVDYMQDVKLLKDGAPSEKVVMPSNPKSILVSAKEHSISTNIIECTTTLESEEECQL